MTSDLTPSSPHNSTQKELRTSKYLHIIFLNSNTAAKSSYYIFSYKIVNFFYFHVNFLIMNITMNIPLPVISELLIMVS